MCTYSLSPSPSSSFSFPFLPPAFTSPAPKTSLRFPAVVSASKDVWRRVPDPDPNTTPSSHRHRHRHRRKLQGTAFLDHTVDMDDLLSSIRATENEHDLNAILSPYKSRNLSIRFMVSLLSREPDWRRSLALLDWINDVALYTPSVFAYNVVLRNVLRASQWDLAHGLFDEMRRRALSPDRYTYSTLITAFGKSGNFDAALAWLQKMEEDRVSGDLVLYSNLIELSRKLCDYSKAISIFLRLKRMGIMPDLVDKRGQEFVKGDESRRGLAGYGELLDAVDNVC